MKNKVQLPIVVARYYIYNNELEEYLYWDENVLEFDTYESAERFLDSALSAMNLTKEEAGEFITIKTAIMYEENIFNATHYIVGYDENGVEEMLVAVAD